MSTCLCFVSAGLLAEIRLWQRYAISLNSLSLKRQKRWWGVCLFVVAEPTNSPLVAGFRLCRVDECRCWCVREKMNLWSQRPPKKSNLISGDFCLEVMNFVNQCIIQTFPCAVRETSQVAVVSLHMCCLHSQSGVCHAFQWQVMHDKSLFLSGLLRISSEQTRDSSLKELLKFKA